MQDPQPYSDIIDRPHHSSARHPHMSRRSRAAQFASFAALSGYEAAVAEAGRRTEQPPELTEDALAVLDERMQHLLAHISERPAVSVTCFVPDARKAGGSLEIFTGCVRCFDEYEHTLVFTDGRRIPLMSVLALEQLTSMSCKKTDEFIK